MSPEYLIAKGLRKNAFSFSFLTCWFIKVKQKEQKYKVLAEIFMQMH